MALDTTQKATLKTYILADPTLTAMTSGVNTDYGALAAALNANASPVQLAWRAAVPTQEIDEAADYTVFDSIAAGKRDSWGFFLSFPRDFTRAKVRKWVVDVWGAATAGSASETILLAATEKASRAEFALGGIDRTQGSVTASNRNWIGDITISAIGDMFNANRIG